MTDILDAAQTTIPSPPAPVGEPTPPVPEPMTPAVPPNSDSLIIPPLPVETPVKEDPHPTVTSPAPPQNIPKKAKKKSSIGVLLAGLLLLVITIPLLVIFVKQQEDIRSRADNSVYPNCTGAEPSGCPTTANCIYDPTTGNYAWSCPSTTVNQCAVKNLTLPSGCPTTANCIYDPTTGNYAWSCPDSTTPPSCSQVTCSGSSCSVPSSLYGANCWVAHYWCKNGVTGTQSCDTTNGVQVGSAAQSISYSETCGEEQIDVYCSPCGIGGTIATGGKFISTNHGSCNTPTPTPQKTSTPTPTPTGTQCISIVAYDTNGNALSDTELAALQPGTTINIRFAPGGAATKVQFQVNTGGWNITTTKNINGQFIWDYKLDNETSFTIEAQWFDGTNWH